MIDIADYELLYTARVTVKRGRIYGFGDGAKMNNASKRPLTQANLRCKGSSALNRGHKHHHAIKRCSACERRPRRAGGVQRGSGT